ncbi:MAG: DUF4835 family protein [Flavobacteriaceae bacterium]|nr:DUF4835 family protein [Flavobacteriaceae bacterium]
MNKILPFFISLSLTFSALAQEFQCKVIVNSEKIPGSNKQIFSTLEKALNEFVNQKKWANQSFDSKEPIECVFTINILEQPSQNEFKASIQLQASRPVFNSTYSTPIFNYKDDQFSFRYTEFEPLFYNPNNFQSNLVSVIAYYSYVVLGFDADTFADKGGNEYYYQAQNVVNLAQQSSYLGWNSNDGLRNRYNLINELLSTTFDVVRNSFYQYHINGLDTMFADNYNAKEVILNSIISMDELFNQRPNSILIRVFMDAKSEEIVNIFSDGPKIETQNLKRVLNSISATNSSKWQKIK